MAGFRKQGRYLECRKLERLLTGYFCIPNGRPCAQSGPSACNRFIPKADMMTASTGGPCSSELDVTRDLLHSLPIFPWEGMP